MVPLLVDHSFGIQTRTNPSLSSKESIYLNKVLNLEIHPSFVFHLSLAEKQGSSDKNGDKSLDGKRTGKQYDIDTSQFKVSCSACFVIFVITST